MTEPYGNWVQLISPQTAAAPAAQMAGWASINVDKETLGHLGWQLHDEVLMALDSTAILVAISPVLLPGRFLLLFTFGTNRPMSVSERGLEATRQMRHCSQHSSLRAGITSNTAKPGYTAYTYPHPRAGGGGEPPSAPQHCAHVPDPNANTIRLREDRHPHSRPPSSDR